MNRREFLKRTAAAAALAASGDALASSLPGGATSIPWRRLGSTGVTVSVFGFPGTAVMDVEQTVANDLVARAFERGVNFYDVSPSYGNAQERLGPALEPYRKRCFLASKTDCRDAETAEKDLEKSLRVLRTDCFDLFQHHAVKRVDLEDIAAPGGAMEAFLAAKKAGKVRFLGLSTHNLGVAIEAMETLPLDTIMFPVSYVLSSKVKIGPQVVERARAKKMGVIAIKAMARGKYAVGQPRVTKCWYEPCGEEAALAWRWSVSQDVDVSIPPGNPVLFQLALELSQRHAPLSAEEERRLLEFSDGAAPLFTFTEP
jgi:predicted aldo/keto reductase-like oxidoreductase